MGSRCAANQQITHATLAWFKTYIAAYFAFLKECSQTKSVDTFFLSTHLVLEYLY